MKLRQQVIDCEHAYRDALFSGDTAALERLLDSGFYATLAVAREGVRVLPREVFVSTTKLFKYDSLEIQDVDVHITGTTAVSTLRWIQRATWDGTRRDGEFSMTSIWAKRGDLWLLTSRHVGRPTSLVGDVPELDNDHLDSLESEA